MAILTNADMQGALQAAEAHLTEIIGGQYNDDNSKLTFLREFFRFTRLYSASSNSIPGFGGRLGIYEAVTLAKQVVESGVTQERDIEIFRITQIAESIAVSERKR